jgi:hypothetical protein
MAVEEAFQELGWVQGLVECGKKNPGDFYRLLARLLPVNVKTEFTDLAFIDRSQSILEEILGQAHVAPATPAEPARVIDAPITPLLKIIGNAGSGRDPAQQHVPLESPGSDKQETRSPHAAGFVQQESSGILCPATRSAV